MTLAWPDSPGTHTVQVYEDEDFLHRAVVAFLTEGARHGGPLVMLTRRRTFDTVATLMPGHNLIFVDAETSVDAVMTGPTLDPALLERSYEGLLAALEPTGKTGPIWVYGEMVDILCQQGHRQAAVQLEECWNKVVIGRRPIATMCSYAIARFDDAAGAHTLRSICRQHTHIMPTETFVDAPDDRVRFERLVLLEQGARAFNRPAAHAAALPEPAAPSLVAPIYVIDDDPSVRKSLARLVASASLDVRTFASAEDFLAEIDVSSSGCIIVDVQLLGMSGMDLQRRLADVRARWPIIAMSGAYDANVEHEALRLGAVAFLRKPFPAQSLLDAIARARDTGSTATPRPR